MNQSNIVDLLIVMSLVFLIGLISIRLNKRYPPYSGKLSKQCRVETNEIRNVGPTSPISIITGSFAGLIIYTLLRALSDISIGNCAGITLIVTVLTYFMSMKSINCYMARTFSFTNKLNTNNM